MALTFVALFIAWWVGHSVGDHWVQTGTQAVEKGFGPPGCGNKKLTHRGQLACLRHVLTLTATKLVLTAAVFIAPLGLHADLRWLAAGVAVDAVTHYWADRRWTLEELSRWVDKGEFYDQGTDLTDVAGERRPHLGTGKYALDQSWHHLWLFVGALIAAM